MEERQYGNLVELLEGDGVVYEYFHSLPSPVRAALRRQESITTFAEIQSFAADEGEPFY